VCCGSYGPIGRVRRPAARACRTKRAGEGRRRFENVLWNDHHPADDEHAVAVRPGRRPERVQLRPEPRHPALQCAAARHRRLHAPAAAIVRAGRQPCERAERRQSVLQHDRQRLRELRRGPGREHRRAERARRDRQSGGGVAQPIYRPEPAARAAADPRRDHAAGSDRQGRPGRSRKRRHRRRRLRRRAPGRRERQRRRSRHAAGRPTRTRSRTRPTCAASIFPT
jgi:hypothetical protein